MISFNCGGLPLNEKLHSCSKNTEKCFQLKSFDKHNLVDYSSVNNELNPPSIIVQIKCKSVYSIKIINTQAHKDLHTSCK